MDPENLTRGQVLALDQLDDIAAESDGVLEIVSVDPPSSEGESVVIRISIETGEYERAEGGFVFRNREPLKIYIPSRFPISVPSAFFVHSRFMGRPHVQWGKSICLYQSPDVEWTSIDGMFGFVCRLDDWMRDAALNRLDPEDAPLHPPVVYSCSSICFVIGINAPEISNSSSYWIGAAHIEKRNGICFDVAQWTEIGENFPNDKRLAATILLDNPMPMEYPRTVYQLIETLEERGVAFSHLFTLLKLFALYQKNDEYLYFVIGAPMRRRAAGEPLRQHLAVWRIEPQSVDALRKIVNKQDKQSAEEAKTAFFKWAVNADTEWCTVYDDRTEVTIRRDEGSNANWLLGKKIAILGCGALGSHIASFVVRSGVSMLRLVDNSAVKPGVLVRQQFSACQVGYTKESALSRQMLMIDPKANVESIRADLRNGFPENLNVHDFDLVVDATASRHVSAALQIDLEGASTTPPILSCSIDGMASMGIATLKMPKSNCLPSDLIRLTKIKAFSQPDLKAHTESFWPKNQRSLMFQPEPGCSEPTFVGSASDMAYFSSVFLDFALQVVAKKSDNLSYILLATKPQMDSIRTTAVSSVIEVNNISSETEVLHGYRVIVSKEARKALQSEIESNKRSGSELDETGGLLLGEIDDALSTIYIDVATCPPPDSVKSPKLFQCGIEGTQQICEFHNQKSGGATRFVGVWHTHPVSSPDPSKVDLQAMAQLLHFQEHTPRHVVMLIIGCSASKPVWNFHLFRKNQFLVLTERENGLQTERN